MAIASGLTMDSGLHADMINASVEVLRGSLRVDFPDLGYTRTLHVNDSLEVGLANYIDTLFYRRRSVSECKIVSGFVAQVMLAVAS